ncbi:MAG: UDP-N-acetylmuramoyl-L-alanyl-D-glutamate--2,6-diaminopimelate ligase [PVC group bacterium]|nr:UDP-N-acetylmuramoyl-L-alanyl-D-glutamate--2,6-diaminopimelate ligase [PVC group bacterium]
MKASEIVKLFDAQKNVNVFDDFQVKGLSIDSRHINADYCFIALRGTDSDGHDFISQAVAKGSRMVIYERGYKFSNEQIKNTVFIPVADSRQALGVLASEFFAHPSRGLKIIGITGTNGKTTVSLLIENMLKNNGFYPGVLGTIHYKIGDLIIPAKNTTPDILTLQSLFAQMIKINSTHAVMEVSSHALDQSRVQGLEFQTAVFTNLTQDHLDYHKDMEQYFNAKSKLFINLKPNSYAVINTDDPYAVRLKKLTQAKIIDYGIKSQESAVRAVDISLAGQGSSFSVITPQGQVRIKTKLIGRHNIYNLLACICVGLQEGISLEKISASIEIMDTVPGRLEVISFQQPFKVFVDYAHTDDALKNVLKTLRELDPRKIITVFGCGGDRDKKKRLLMGKVASEMADFLIITNDNPRTESPDMIIEGIKAGFKGEFKDYEVILDRKEAINKALSIAQADDFVLIAGKGHETYQIFKDKTIDFDDRIIVKEILENNV